MDLAKLYSDKTAYPDEMTVEIQGEKMSLKEWRDSLGLKSEFTKHTQELSEKGKQAGQVIQQLQQREAQLQQQLASAMQQRGMNPAHAQDDDLAAYRQDPAFGPLVKLIEAQQGTLQQLAQRQQMDEVAVNSWRYQQQLDKIKESDPDADPQEIARQTQQLWQKGPDVNIAHRLMTEEKGFKKAVDEAEKRGYEKARTEPPIPPQPGRGRGGSVERSQELPKLADGRPDMDARIKMAAQEFGPALQEALQNQ